MNYIDILCPALGIGLLYTFMSRLDITQEIKDKLGHHANRKWKKRCAGQSFREWLFYERFDNEMPSNLVLYHTVIISLFVIFAVASVILHFGDPGLRFFRFVENIFWAYAVVVDIICVVRWTKLKRKG